MFRSTAFLFLTTLMVIVGCSATTTAPGLTPQPTDTLPPAADTPFPATDIPLPTATPIPPWNLADSELTGIWLGAMTVPQQGVPRTLRAVITEGLGQLTARLVLQQANGMATIVDNIPITIDENDALAFSANLQEIGELDFRGELTAAGIHGTVGDGQFWLIKPFAIDDWSPYSGAYRFDDDRVVSVSPSPGVGSSLFLGEGMWFSDYTTGDYRALIPVAEDTFLVGPALGVAMPATAVIQFANNTDGRYTTLSWQPLNEHLTSASNALAAGRLDFPAEEVTFDSEGVTLAGTLTLPLGEGPFPAIVQVHGSGRTTRDMLQRQAHFLASEGFAVLSYDKRGVGESGGVYSGTASESRLLLLAQDAASGAAFLSAHPSVGAQPIGLIGSSQAGWIIPAAAALSDEINFVVILSGPVVTVSQEGVYSDITGDGMNVLTQSDEEIAAALEPAASRGFDPLPYIEQLEIPALWLWGGQDLSIPVTVSRDNLEAIITNNSKENFDYVLFPNGDHALWESESGQISDWPFIRQTVPDLHDTIRRWLEERVGGESS